MDNRDQTNETDTAELNHTSPTSPDSETAATAPETLSDLVLRLQTARPRAPVKILFSRNPNTKPALVSSASLIAVSTYFAQRLDATGPYPWFKEDDEWRFGFADYPSEAVKFFLYWLVHRAVPEVEDIDSLAIMRSVAGDGGGEEGDGVKAEYQVLLARSWCFAAEMRIPGMQNDVMRCFITALRERDLTVEVLQKVPRFAQRESKLRAAVLEEALYLGKERDGVRLMEGLGARWPFGLVWDLGLARAAVRKRMGVDGASGGRGRWGEYLVPV